MRRSEEGIKRDALLTAQASEAWGEVSVSGARRQGRMADASKASRFIPSSNDPQPRTKDDDEDEEEQDDEEEYDDENETLNNYKHKNP